MYQLLDFTGAYLYIAFRIITLPLLFVLYLFFAILLLIKYIRIAVKAVCRFKLRKVESFYRSTRYNHNLRNA